MQGRRHRPVQLTYGDHLKEKPSKLTEFDFRSWPIEPLVTRGQMQNPHAISRFEHTLFARPGAMARLWIAILLPGSLSFLSSETLERGCLKQTAASSFCKETLQKYSKNQTTWEKIMMRQMFYAFSTCKSVIFQIQDWRRFHKYERTICRSSFVGNSKQAVQMHLESFWPLPLKNAPNFIANTDRSKMETRILNQLTPCVVGITRRCSPHDSALFLLAFGRQKFLSKI